MNKKILLTMIAVVTTITVMAQGRMDLRINEIMVQNDSNYVDQYDHRSGWIEIFNASHGTNGIEKMFITTLPKDFMDKQLAGVSKSKTNQVLLELCKSKKNEIFVIPLGDVATKVKPRSHVVFFADGNIEAGTFHLPFTLKPGQDNYIALYDVNGDLVDEVTVPANLPADQSFARISEDEIDLHGSHNFEAKLWQMCDGKTDSTTITPGKFNTRPINNNIDMFKKEDGIGWKLTIMSMGVVFSALLMLYILFKLFGKAFTAKDKKKEDEVDDKAVEEPTAAPEGDDDEAIAAICMALYQHLNAHDEESGVITIDHSHEAHSAWGSKGNLLLRVPEHHEHK
ncbi:MAG: OadG family protein [Muribaculaceae bacterium]|nr:OadG family protein [Muribaculaceae bacterium]